MVEENPRGQARFREGTPRARSTGAAALYAHVATSYDSPEMGSFLAGVLIAATFAAPEFLQRSDHLESATASRAAGGVRDAAIVWDDGDAIFIANVDGRGRHVLVPQFADSEGDPTWTLDGRALAFYTRNSDDVRIRVRWPGTHRERVLRADYRSPPHRPAHTPTPWSLRGRPTRRASPSATRGAIRERRSESSRSGRTRGLRSRIPGHTTPTSKTSIPPGRPTAARLPLRGG